jgi:hypothetical protein
MHGTTFYDAGPVITKASFIGFCRPDNKDKCKHQVCGFEEKAYKCPACGKEHVVKHVPTEESVRDPKTGNYTRKKLTHKPCCPKGYWVAKTRQQSSACHTNIFTMPTIHGESVDCQMKRFRSFTVEELANPATSDIRYALIEVEFAATFGTHLFVADLDKIDFVNSEMTLNRTGKEREKWLAYPGQFREPVDISKIINKKEVITQIGKVFGQ